MVTGLIYLALFAAFFKLMAQQASAVVWTISLFLLSVVFTELSLVSWFMLGLLYLGTCFSLFMSITPLRKAVVSKKIMGLLHGIVPSMSSTEREALEAGTISWEGDVFSGAPDYEKLLKLPTVTLTDEEQAFLDGPVNELCRMIDDWDITHNRADMPKEMWDFIAKNKFWAMIIPKEYGGLGFSASAQVAILVKIYGRSVSVATTVSVPNSLGPGELLLEYGTQAQREYYLPRLATGEEIPCFALTGPNAGSDAASLPDTGVVCKQMVDGEEVVGIRLNWNKRYITLAPVATLLGLAFRLFDPENILGKGEDIGITCALIGVDTPGVTTGRRHFPLNTALMNGPTQGKDVFIHLDDVIGGEAMVGQGWRMLMDCLSAGRAISLPSSAMAGGQLCASTCGAYARVRQQFNQSISKFEGIEEPLARIAGNAYIIDASLTMAAAAIDNGEKPAVVGAILKYHATERGRAMSMDAMDIHGGKGICLGPNNYLGRGYQSAPIGITVEGANILTRSLIIFGQGAVRCHPYVHDEMESIRNKDLSAFDKAFWGHGAFTIANLVRSFFLGLTDGRGSRAPKSLAKRHYKMLNRYASSLAFMSNFAMGIMGGELKRREKISARLGDILSSLYLASAVLKRFHDDGEPEEDKALVDWSCLQLFYDCEVAMANIIANFPGKPYAIFLRCISMPMGRKRTIPRDNLGHKLAKILTTPGAARDRLTRFVFRESIDNCPVGKLEEGFRYICSIEALEKKFMKAWKSGDLLELTALQRIEEALQKGFISNEEAEMLRKAEGYRQYIIAVDDFSSDALARESMQPKPSKKPASAHKASPSKDKISA